MSRHAPVVAGTALLVASFSVPAIAQPVSFEDDVFPILELRCVECHQPGGQGYEANGLDLTSYEGVMEGTRNGPVIVPREYVSSTLGAAIDWRVNPQIRMPYHGKKLSKCELLMIRQWIQQGAHDN